MVPTASSDRKNLTNQGTPHLQATRRRASRGWRVPLNFPGVPIQLSVATDYSRWPLLHLDSRNCLLSHSFGGAADPRTIPDGRARLALQRFLKPVTERQPSGSLVKLLCFVGVATPEILACVIHSREPRIKQPDSCHPAAHLLLPLRRQDEADAEIDERSVFQSK